MGINAAKGVDIGDGFAAARQRGSECRDALARTASGYVAFAMNHAGGNVGGISTGQDLHLRVAF
jgi:chorismate synthase